MDVSLPKKISSTCWKLSDMQKIWGSIHEFHQQWEGFIVLGVKNHLGIAICHAKLWPRPWHLRAGEPLSVLSSWATFQINVPVWPLQVWFCPSWFIDPRWVMNESPQWQYFGAGVQIVHPWIFRVSLLHGKLEEEPYIIGKRVGMLFVDLHSLVFNRS